MSSLKEKCRHTIILENVQFMDSKIDGPLWYAHKMPVGSQLTFDFSKIQYLRPEAVILLIVVSNMIYERVGEPIKWTNLPRGGSYYLSRIGIDKIDFIQVERGILDYFQIGSQQKELTYLVPLKIIRDSTQLNTVIKSIRGKMGEWFPGRPNTFPNEVCTILSEIVGNSLEHSVLQNSNDVPTCYLTVQRYMPSQTDNPKAIIALGDIGIGIGGSLRNAKKAFGKDLPTLQRAFFHGVSSRESSGGLGFLAISDLLSQNGGHITIRSGTGSLHYCPQSRIKKSFSHKQSLIGTQTSFLL